MPESQLYQQRRNDVEQIIQHYQEEWERTYYSRVTPNVAPADWVSILTRFIASVFDLFVHSQASAADRRDAVIVAGMNFYRQVLQPVVAQAINHPLIFNSFIAPAIERALPGLLGGLYDALARIIGKLTGAIQPVPAPPGTTSVPTGFQPY